MSSPCVEDTPTIVLSTAGAPAVLTADFANEAGAGSETQGDDTTHVVTDSDVPHIQTQTNVIDNSAGLAPLSGIVVVALNPIWAGLPDAAGVSLIWEASLSFAGHPTWGDQRDTITTAVAENEAVTFSPGSLVGTFVVPAGATQSFTWEKRITNDGASAQWSFRMGGDRVVYIRNFG